mmetsp:Transcript_87108/g.244363  ORF Transcript_87108/g.244363 Transcript_87108/m.244363 type:complete len:207 (+) Transcript_87108:929-1549(+)
MRKPATFQIVPSERFCSPTSTLTSEDFPAPFAPATTVRLTCDNVRLTSAKLALSLVECTKPTLLIWSMTFLRLFTPSMALGFGNMNFTGSLAAPLEPVLNFCGSSALCRTQSAAELVQTEAESCWAFRFSALVFFFFLPTPAQSIGAGAASSMAAGSTAAGVQSSDNGIMPSASTSAVVSPSTSAAAKATSSDIGATLFAGNSMTS